MVKPSRSNPPLLVYFDCQIPIFDDVGSNFWQHLAGPIFFLIERAHDLLTFKKKISGAPSSAKIKLFYMHNPGLKSVRRLLLCLVDVQRILLLCLSHYLDLQVM